MRPTFYWSFKLELTDCGAGHEWVNAPAGNSQKSVRTEWLHHYTFSSAQFSSSENPGLSLRGELVYNEQQNLPLAGKFQLDAVRFSLNSEGAMKPARPKKTNCDPVVLEESAESRTVETRAQRLARIKQEIESGSYETEEKLELAIERMLGTFRGE